MAHATIKYIFKLIIWRCVKHMYDDDQVNDIIQSRR